MLGSDLHNLEFIAEVNNHTSCGTTWNVNYAIDINSVYNRECSIYDYANSITTIRPFD